jgi:hypothetical protein
LFLAQGAQGGEKGAEIGARRDQPVMTRIDE